MEVGYKLASEEQGPNELVRYAGLAEEHGFGFALISDHFHPWIDRQGQSPFVWSVIGAIAHTTQRLRLGTAVTCPTVRVHPAIVAQAAATAAAMMPGRFFLGVGTGENLNEHIVGQVGRKRRFDRPGSSKRFRLSGCSGVAACRAIAAPSLPWRTRASTPFRPSRRPSWWRLGVPRVSRLRRPWVTA